jgi:hypothetical protein
VFVSILPLIIGAIRHRMNGKKNSQPGTESATL